MTVVAKTGGSWIGFVLTILDFLPQSSDLREVGQSLIRPFVEIVDGVADQLRKLLEKDGVFIPLFFDRAGELVCDGVSNRGIAFRLFFPTSLNGNIVEDIQWFYELITSRATTWRSSNWRMRFS